MMEVVMMNDETTQRRVFQLLADALDYPGAALAEAVNECVALLVADNLAAAVCKKSTPAPSTWTPLGIPTSAITCSAKAISAVSLC